MNLGMYFKSIIQKVKNCVFYCGLKKEVYNDYFVRMDSVVNSIQKRISSNYELISADEYNLWHEDLYKLEKEIILVLNKSFLKNFIGYRRLNKEYLDVKKLNSDLKNIISNYNNRIICFKVKDAYKIIGNVEGKQLDQQQMKCIVKNAHSHIVIAGAGTGKTTTIIGKIKYLINKNIYSPEDILVLSFTNASAKEMEDRINKEMACQIDAFTFHKLGLEIIKEVEGKSPNVTNLSMIKFIKDEIKRCCDDCVYLNKLSNYIFFDKNNYKSEFDFNSKGEYEEYLKTNPPTTLKGESVKSYGEMDIANFLFQNGVNYEYESNYKVNTQSKEFSQYKPDFYLPGYNIYIEYFGIDRKGNVPSYFEGKDGRSAAIVYNEGILWKRKLHIDNKTTLVECYAYEKIEANLINNLKEKLINNNVIMCPKSQEELWNQISDNKNSFLDGISLLFQTVINLIKSNNYTFEYVRNLVNNSDFVRSNNILLDLIEPIFKSYCSYLFLNNEIDFNDMINKAREYVDQGKFNIKYKYVIVDEYQDISKSRFSLLKSMRDKGNYDLFCVGDDWQSIYRFNGSDVDYIVDFEKYWGESDISKIETTYRFDQGLIDISSNFIMKNPRQIEKKIKGKNGNLYVIGEICGYTEKLCVDFMLERLDGLPRYSTVYFLGRYTFDVEILKQNDFLRVEYDKINDVVKVFYKKRLDLNMNFLTVHKSKGLQADYVFIVNNKMTRMGFPNKIQDSPLLDLLLEGFDSFPYNEERRLFYVALTRAKKKVYLLTLKDNIGEFASELKSEYCDILKKERYICPNCGGMLVRKKSVNGEFLGCSNYRFNNCKFTRSIKK